MYLFRATNCTYYTRICLSKSLRDLGFPFDLKISLLTKIRAIATRRNVQIASAINQTIDLITPETTPDKFKASLNQKINEIRLNFVMSEAVCVPIRPIATIEIEVRDNISPTAKLPLHQALDEFICSKGKEGVRPLTIKQLKQRISHFIDAIEPRDVNGVTSGCALRYRDLLLEQGRSYKTNKEYLAACSQFYHWCCLMNYVVSNPFVHIKLKQKLQTGENSARQRWYPKDLCFLVNSDEYKQVDTDFRWVTLLLLHHGLRPSEACQLRTDDIVQQGGIYCIRISDDGDKQRVKNASSRRVVPIHDHLLEIGFLNFVEEAKQTGRVQLFHYMPTNQNQDWSRQYCRKLGLIQTKIGMKPGSRPGAYSFRHTFVDELKQLEVNESIVAQIIGHKNEKITFGRYGKEYSVNLQAKYLNLVSYPISTTSLT